MKRRDFIQKTGAGTALLTLGGLNPLYAGTPKDDFKNVDIKKITILHTNDVHSYIDPFPADDPKNAFMGGVARRAALIAGIRTENPNVLLLDAGDIFQGTPYFLSLIHI
jgi:5'-nucleotidase